MQEQKPDSPSLSPPPLISNQPQTTHISTQIPHHLNPSQLPQLTHSTTTILTTTPFPTPFPSLSFCPTKPAPKFSFTHKFQPHLCSQILHTNFQSMWMRLHYGHFQTQISVICTEIDQRILDDGDQNVMRGAFGVVRFGGDGDRRFAVKGIKGDFGEQGVDGEKGFQEYFMGLVAGILGIGPQIIPVFGYDILITKKMLFFGMQQCSPPNEQHLFQARDQLIQNLQIMHSINFIHNDIKPSNVAYSDRLKKYVYIDFGLSRFIKQSPGQKCKTRFRGSLSYCGDQMKKCYFLGQARFVDLYQSDLISLQKTLTSFQKTQTSLYSQPHPFSPQPQPQPLTHLITPLTLKHLLQTQNKPQLLKFLSKKRNTLRVVYQIFSSDGVPRSVAEDQDILGMVAKIREVVLGDGFQLGDIDRRMCGFLGDNGRIVSAEKILPISHLLQVQSQVFHKYLTSPHLLLKLLHYLQPTPSHPSTLSPISPSTSSPTSIPSLSLSPKHQLLTKIFLSLKPHLSQKPVFTAQKLRTVLIFFYEKTRLLGNWEVMGILRVMFVAVEEWGYARLVEEDMVEGICDGQGQEQGDRVQVGDFMRMLWIGEFFLLKDAILAQYEYQRNQKWLKILQQTPTCPTSTPQTHLLKSFLQSLTPSPKYSTNALSSNLALLTTLHQITKYCQTNQQKQCIYRIKVMFGWICGVGGIGDCGSSRGTGGADGGDCGDQVGDMEMGRDGGGFAMRVYERYFGGMARGGAMAAGPGDDDLFWPLWLQVRKIVSEQGGISRPMLETHFEILKERNEFIGNFILKMGQLNLVDKVYLDYFLQQLQIQFKTQPEPLPPLYVPNRLLSLTYLLHYTTKTTQKSSRKPLLEMLHNLFTNFIKQKHISEIIQTSVKLRVEVRIMRVRLGLELGVEGGIEGEMGQIGEMGEIEGVVEDLWALIRNGGGEVMGLAVDFLGIVQRIFRDLGDDTDKQKEHYSSNMLLKIGDEFLARKSFSIFQKSPTFLSNYLLLLSHQSTPQKSLQTYLQILHHFHSKPASSPLLTSTSTQSFLSSTQTLLTLLPTPTLTQLYSQLQSHPEELSCPYYAYFIFCVFVKVRQEGTLGKEEEMRRFVRSSYCVSRGNWIWGTKRWGVLELCGVVRGLGLGDGRGGLGLGRLEARNGGDLGRTKLLISLMRNKIANFTKSKQCVIARLNQKIKKLKYS